VYNAVGALATVMVLSLQEIVSTPFRHQDSAIGLYLHLVRNGVVFDGGLTLGSGSVTRPTESMDNSLSFISSPRTRSLADMLI
jgi:hypothetical protein